MSFPTYSPPFISLSDVYRRNMARGDYKLERFTISRSAAIQSLLVFASTGDWQHAHVAPGDYVRLVREAQGERQIVMSDTPAERRTNLRVVREARGRVFVAGLGLGMIVLPIARKPEVKRILVIEKSPDVCDLVLPALRRALGRNARKLVVTPGDVFEFQPEAKFDTIYFDSWPTIEPENLAQIAALKRRWGRWYLAPGGWMGAWAEAMTRYGVRSLERLNERAKRLRPNPNPHKAQRILNQLVQAEINMALYE